jgi:hypothetical protein
VVAACGRTVETYGPAGRSIRTDSVVPGIDRVRSSGDGRHILGFRPGGRRILPLVFGGEVGESWEAPAPTLDLLVERPPARTPATALLATTGGLHRVALDGSVLATREDLGVLLAIGARAHGLVALSAGGRLTWLDEDLEVLRTGTVPSGTRVLVAPPHLGGGLGLGPESVISIAAGRLGADGGVRLALAVADRLSIVDPATGRESFRADWPGIRGLAAGDLDGDGREELVVGSDRRVTVLRSIASDPG